MKNFLFIMTFVACALASHAQQIGLGPLHSPENLREDWLLPGDTLMTATDTIVYGGKPKQMTRSAAPTLLYKGLAGQQPDVLRPDTLHAGWTSAVSSDVGNYGWGLHEGLNASLSLSAFATFGGHAPHRGGFGQTLDLTYLKPFGKLSQGWLALGGYLNHVNYGSDNYHDAGFYAALGYRFDDHWEGYVYGQLSVANNYRPRYRYYGYGPYGYGGINGLGGVLDVPVWGGGLFGVGMGCPGSNVIGAGVIYHFSPSFSIGINAEMISVSPNQVAGPAQVFPGRGL